MSTKDEIMDLPAGKSSAEIDEIMMDGEPADEESQKEADLAAEALEATEGDLPAEESTVDEKAEEEKKEVVEEPSETDRLIKGKDSKIAAQKHQTRELELENAKLQGQLEERQRMAPETPEKSPLEIAMEAEGVEHPDDLEKPYGVMQAQLKWEKEQDAKAASTDKQQKIDPLAMQAEDDLQEGILSEESMGRGLDLRTVAGIGEQYLTRGDKVDIVDVKQGRGEKAALRQMYKTCMQRTLAANNEDSKLLQNAIKLKGKTVTREPKVENKDDVVVDDDTGETGSGKTTVGKRLFQFITS